MFQTRYAKRRQEAAAIETDVLGKQIEEAFAKEQFRTVLEAHRRKYNPSALARSLKWKRDDGQ